MASAKYKRGSDGCFQARIWDGTYTEDGKKKRITLRSKKSSRDLENMVKEMEQKVQERKYVRQTDICHKMAFCIQSRKREKYNCHVQKYY